jgi:phosphate:Na+ symporter
LRQAQEFISKVDGPPESEDEQRRLTSTLHALDHASRLAEAAGGTGELNIKDGGPDDERAAQLCAETMRDAATIAAQVATLPVGPDQATSVDARGDAAQSIAEVTSYAEALAKVERDAAALEELQLAHRAATLGAVASGTLTADDAIIRVDAVRRLKDLSHHAWRSVAHLVSRG